MKEILNFDGQEVTYKKEEGYLFIYIDETFHSAGSYFNWSGNKEGIGINKKIIDFAYNQFATLVIDIRNHQISYFVDAEIWKSFCEASNSIYKVKNTNVILYVFPLSKLQKQKTNEIVVYKQERLL